MISAFINCLKIPDLKKRIGYTLWFVFIARIGANIPLPGLDPAPLQNFFADQSAAGGGTLVGLYNMFTGGALLKGAVCALGIMPYISASIIFQLLAPVVPSLARLQQEGDVGRQKITQYTRYATVGICLVQGSLLILALTNPAKLFNGYDINYYGPIVLQQGLTFIITSVMILTAGSILLMWLGEQITERGVSNGVSLLITVGILADLPGAAALTYRMFNAPVGVEGLTLAEGVLMFVLLLFCIAGIVAITQAMRKIPVNYAKRVVGRKVYGGQSSYLPLKVNYSGVMPVIFASAILLFFQMIFQQLGAISDQRFLQDFALLMQQGQPTYYVVFGILILGFSYFWVSMMFRPLQIADDLKKNGGYIPGVRPGEPTAKFLDFVMTRLTLFGAIALTVIAVFPDALLFSFNVPYQVAQFFGGTGMLIVVGVLLDALRQIETFLLQRHYDGFLRKGRIRGRSTTRTQQLTDVGELTNQHVFWIYIGIGLAVGLVCYILESYV